MKLARKLAITGALVALTGVESAFAELTVTTRTRHYTVHGSNINSVVKAMKRSGPYSENEGKRALGLADYRFTWSLRTKRTPSGCAVSSLRARLSIFYILPRLTARSRLSKRDRSRWNSIYRMIDVHERVHGRFYRQFANSTYRAILKLKPQPNCSQLQRRAKAIEDRMVKLDRRRNRAFDRAQYRPFNRRLKRLRGQR
ncbi:MAG: DUF922 domain-containing protein [Pseudomonadota bacterium]